MNLVCKSMPSFNGAFEVVVQVVYVHVAVAEATARRDMEVADHAVDAQAALDTATFFTLGVEALAVVLPLTLLDVFATAKSPGHGGVRLAHFFAGIATAGLDRIRGCVGTIAAAAVVRIEMHCDVVLRVANLH